MASLLTNIFEEVEDDDQYDFGNGPFLIMDEEEKDEDDEDDDEEDEDEDEDEE